MRLRFFLTLLAVGATGAKVWPAPAGAKEVGGAALVGIAEEGVSVGAGISVEPDAMKENPEDDGAGSFGGLDAVGCSALVIVSCTSPLPVLATVASPLPERNPKPDAAGAGASLLSVGLAGVSAAGVSAAGEDKKLNPLVAGALGAGASASEALLRKENPEDAGGTSELAAGAGAVDVAMKLKALPAGASLLADFSSALADPPLMSKPPNIMDCLVDDT